MLHEQYPVLRFETADHKILKTVTQCMLGKYGENT